MSEAMLYRAFHVQGYELERYEFDAHRVLMHLRPQAHRVFCPKCLSRNIV